MKIKNLLGRDKESTGKATAAKAEPAKAAAKWKPKPAGRGAKVKKRF